LGKGVFSGIAKEVKEKERSNIIMEILFFSDSEISAQGEPMPRGALASY
jgi:hypothetical protein